MNSDWEEYPLATSMKGVLHRKRKKVDDLIELHLERFNASGVELRRKTGTRSGRRSDHTVEQTEPDLTRGGQAGDLQGLSNVRKEIRRAFESWSKKARLSRLKVSMRCRMHQIRDAAEITTREVPEDDVPSDYLADR